MNAADWLQWLALGSLLGMAGQVIRVLVGLKKLQEKRPPDSDETMPGFSTQRLVLSLMIGAVAGALGVLGMASADDDAISAGTLATLVAIGYAGTDFIEGFMRRHAPVEPPGAPRSRPARRRAES